jgi:hypothetical protein
MAASVETRGTTQGGSHGVGRARLANLLCCPRGCPLRPPRSTRRQEQREERQAPEQGVGVAEHRGVVIRVRANRDDGQQQNQSGGQQADHDALTVGRLARFRIWNAEPIDHVFIVGRVHRFLKDRRILAARCRSSSSNLLKVVSLGHEPPCR